MLGRWNRYRRGAVTAIGSTVAAALLIVVGCSLSSEVTIARLVLRPDDIDRSSSVEEAVRAGDYRSAIELGTTYPPEPGTATFSLLASAELATGRFESANDRLLTALELADNGEQRRKILWDLSQVAYLGNDFAKSLEWALLARKEGMGIIEWHIKLLEALSEQSAYRSVGEVSATVPMKAFEPDIPRVEVALSDGSCWSAIVDSGAVMSIVSESLAAKAPVRLLVDFEGLFYGLVQEPIKVRFGVLDSIAIGEIVIESVPVAIMPDNKMNFMIDKSKFGIDLLIGAGLLKEFRMIFDYGVETLSLELLGAEDRIPAQDQNLFFIDFRPFVHATINGRGWYTFLLDTGSEITFLNGMKLRINGLSGIPRMHEATLQGLGGVHQRGARISDIEVGIDGWAGTFKDIPIYNDEKSAAVGIIGQNLLQQFRVTVDFGRMRVDLERSN